MQLATAGTGNLNPRHWDHSHSYTTDTAIEPTEYLMSDIYNALIWRLQQSEGAQKHCEIVETMCRTRSWVRVVVQFVDSPRKGLLRVLVEVGDGDTSCKYSVVWVGGCQRRCRLCGKLVQL